MHNSGSTEVPVLIKQILLVEDETIFANAIKKHLVRKGYKVDLASDLKSARLHFKENIPDLILLDMRLPDGSGLDLLTEIKTKNTTIEVLVMSAYGELEDAVSAMKLGASDYLKKPIDLEELYINVKKVLYKNELTQKLNYSAKREQHAFEGVNFLGECQQIEFIREQVDRISALTQSEAGVPPTVLVLGETGTGKDVVARLLHSKSSLKEKPFVHVDCASLPKDLIESELFGHEKGAFTNANNARAGLIEAAEDGVLFLDEVAEIPIDLQSKLLGVLERRSLRRIGSTKERPIAAWIIAATNRNIESLVKNGEFRSDLYYRLNVMAITIPALRERDNDVVMLGNYYAEATSKRYGLSFDGFSKGALRQIKEYSWYGNVRELKHLIERAVLLSGGGLLDENMLGIDKNVGNNNETEINDDITLGEAELHLIKTALERTNRNVSKAARELGITRMALRYRIRKYNL
tara:strand:- start:1061 stop:2455 length:1395 start_codon:yes stop_codon:yes gene_type:complete